MGLQVILDAIRASGEAQVREIEAQAQKQQQEILCRAQAEAERLRAEARLAALAPAGKERARITQQAQFEALQIVGKAREALIDAILEQARQYLATVRTMPTYPAILRQLIEEALAELEQPEVETDNARLEIDPSDRAVMAGILSDFGLDLEMTYSLKSWGGVIATSHDGRVTVINSIEARFTRAMLYLRRSLTALLEDGLSQTSQEGFRVEA